MDDHISRQAAIDAVHKEFDECLVWDESGKHTADEVERVLADVPSAEVETQMSLADCISRQAAIDAIKTWGLIDGLSEGQAIEILADEEKLPSAQPEIIRCKDCKYWMRAYLSISGKHGCNVMRDYTAPDDYCFKAERKA